MRPHPALAGIYRLSLTEHNPIVSISQYFSLEILHVAESREEIFVEILNDDGREIRVKLLQPREGVKYRFTDTTPFPVRRPLMRVDTSSLLVPERVDREKTTYLITDMAYLHVQPLVEGVPTTMSVSHATTAASFGQLMVTFNAKGIRSDFNVELQNRPMLPLPSDLQLLSSVYQYDVLSKTALDVSIPISIKIKYTDATPTHKTLWYFNKEKNQWIELPSYNNVESKEVSAQVHFPYVIVAVFGNEQQSDGIASWYAYKNCLCAASREYPRGSFVKVTRLKTNKSITVRINDYGPEEWTGRLIDLDAQAFKQLGTLRAGLIYVSVEPLKK